LSEQHSLLLAQALPSVVQLVPLLTSAAHLPPVQVTEQHSVLSAQVSPIVLHTVLPHLPAVQAPLQQSVGSEQASPEGVHAPPTSAQVCEPVSQAPTQQVAALSHA
jgi:hypothetical protein